MATQRRITQSPSRTTNARKQTGNLGPSSSVSSRFQYKPGVKETLDSFRMDIEGLQIFGKGVRVEFDPSKNSLIIRPSVDLRIFDQKPPLEHKFDFSVDKGIAIAKLERIAQVYTDWISTNARKMDNVKHASDRFRSITHKGP